MVVVGRGECVCCSEIILQKRTKRERERVASALVVVLCARVAPPDHQSLLSPPPLCVRLCACVCVCVRVCVVVVFSLPPPSLVGYKTRPTTTNTRQGGAGRGRRVTTSDSYGQSQGFSSRQRLR